MFMELYVFPLLTTNTIFGISVTTTACNVFFYQMVAQNAADLNNVIVLL